MKKNMGTLKEIDLLQGMAKEAAEGVSYLNAIVNNVNLSSLEAFDMRQCPSLFDSDEFCEMICKFFSK